MSRLGLALVCLLYASYLPREINADDPPCRARFLEKLVTAHPSGSQVKETSNILGDLLNLNVSYEDTKGAQRTAQLNFFNICNDPKIICEENDSSNNLEKSKLVCSWSWDSKSETKENEVVYRLIEKNGALALLATGSVSLNNGEVFPDSANTGTLDVTIIFGDIVANPENEFVPPIEEENKGSKLEELDRRETEAPEVDSNSQGSGSGSGEPDYMSAEEGDSESDYEELLSLHDTDPDLFKNSSPSVVSSKISKFAYMVSTMVVLVLSMYIAN